MTRQDNDGSQASQPAGREPFMPRWLGALAPSLPAIGSVIIIAIAIMRMTISFVPQVVFDIDPALDPTVFGGLGPAGSLLLDCLLLLACAAALWGEVLVQRRLRWWLFALAALPLPVIIWHGLSDAGDLWRGMTWFAAVLSAVTLMHTGRDHRLVRMLIAIWLAGLSVVIMRSAAQFFIEHGQTVSEFEQNREAFFDSRGWAGDSPQAATYERRLRQNQPMAWFATTNIFASIASVALVFAIGIVIALRRQGVRRWQFAAAVTALIVTAVALLTTGSKGAFAAAVLATVVLCIGMFIRDRPGLRTIMIVGAIALALLGVVVRGDVLPVDFFNERSLLFRWHYLQSAWSIFFEHPWLGTGIDDFQAAYAHHRVPGNPEEVISAHSMFVDWLCMLGLTALAWCGVVIGTLWTSARCDGREPQDFNHNPQTTARNENRSRPGGVVLNVAAAIAVFALAPALLIEAGVFTAGDLLLPMLRVAGVVAFVIAAPIVWTLLNRSGSYAAHWAVLCGLLAAVIHSQIEMTAFQPNAVVWLLSGVGLVACLRAQQNAGRRVDLIIPVLVAGLVASMFIVAVIPAARQRSAMIDAAQTLAPLADGSADVNAAELRGRAALQLVDAYERWPTNVLPLEAAARQYRHAAAAARTTDDQTRLLESAVDIAQRAVREHGDPSTHALAANTLAALAAADTASAGSLLQAALAHRDWLVRHDPHSPHVFLQRGDLHWHLGNLQQARSDYQQALDNESAMTRFDPLKAMSDDDRNRIEERLNE